MIAEGLEPQTLRGTRVAWPDRAAALVRTAPAHHHDGMSLRWAYLAAFVLMIVSWVVFFTFFALRRKPAGGGKATRIERVSIVGIAFQGLSYAAVWMLE